MSDLAVPRQSGKTTMIVKRAYEYAIRHPETPVILLVQNEHEKIRIEKEFSYMTKFSSTDPYIKVMSPSFFTMVRSCGAALFIDEPQITIRNLLMSIGCTVIDTAGTYNFTEFSE